MNQCIVELSLVSTQDIGLALSASTPADNISGHLLVYEILNRHLLPDDEAYTDFNTPSFHSSIHSFFFVL